MRTAYDMKRFVDELAARYTDPILTILKSAGIRHISVDMEIEAWQALRKLLLTEIRWLRAFGLARVASLRAVMEKALRQVALLVAEKFEPLSVTSHFTDRLRWAVDGRRPTPGEGKTFVKLLSARAEPHPPRLGRSDCFPRQPATALRGYQWHPAHL